MSKKQTASDQIWDQMKTLLRGRHGRLMITVDVPEDERKEEEDTDETTKPGDGTRYRFELTPDGFKLLKKTKVLRTQIEGNFTEKQFKKDDVPTDVTIIPTIRTWLQQIMKNVRNPDSSVKFEPIKK